MNLLHLPPDLLGALVFAWLDTKSIVRLDSSVCSTVRRAAFSGFLNSDYAVLRHLPPATPSATTRTNALQWATLRQLRCRTLALDVGDTMENFRKYLQTVKQPDNVQLSKLKDTAYVCMMLAAHCRSMCSMLCSQCTLSSSVSSIYACCTAMQEIFLYECSLSAEHFARVLCPLVMTLALYRCQCDDQCMIAAVAMCPNIVNLEMGENPLSDKAVHDTVTKLPQLQKLSLYKLPVSDNTVVAVSAACCALNAIDLGACAALTDVAVIALVTNCTQLTYIQLFGSTHCTRESLRTIALHCPGLKQCVLSKFIDANQEDEVLLFNSCRQLESVEIRLSSPVSVSCIPPSVTHLTLPSVIITDEMLYAVAKYCSNLTRLIITQGSPVNRMYAAKGLAAIAKGCTKLQKLVLVGDAAQVTELTLEVWRNTCPQLQVLGAVERW